MLSDKELEELLPIFQKKMDEVNADYIKRIVKHVQDIGELAPSDINRLTEMKRVRVNINSVKRRLARALGMSVHQVDNLMWKAASSNMEFAQQWFGAAAVPKMSRAMKNIVSAQIAQTGGALKNLSQTTISQSMYRKTVDTAIRAVQSGIGDYRSAMRSALNKAALNGVQIQYPSGVKRRADTAVRQNLLDSVHQLNNTMLEQLGEEYGADGVEISAHPLCAEDHLPYQGKQYSKKQFQELQSTLTRPIGQWNCKHLVYPIILGVSRKAYSDEQLAEMRRSSTEKVTIGGETHTRYEWTQEQRKTETAIRWQKDVVNACRDAGDDAGRREAQRKISELDDKYKEISRKTNVNNQRYRMRVEGWSKDD